MVDTGDSKDTYTYYDDEALVKKMTQKARKNGLLLVGNHGRGKLCVQSVG